MDTKEILKYCGSLQQVVYVRPVEYREGRAADLRAVDVKCGDLSFTALADKALDISALSYKGKNMVFLSKPGLQGRNPYDTAGAEAQRSIMGGLFFTSGYENICAPCTIDGTDYPMHGRMRTSPAEHICSDVIEEDGKIKVMVSGETREAQLFGENLLLRRTIESVLGENSILLTDEVQNQSFEDTPLMLLYHINMGFPFLDENCRLYVPTAKVTGREDWAGTHLDKWNEMEPPIDHEAEYVFRHEILADQNLNTIVMVANHVQNLALTVEFNRAHLPYFMEWKSLMSGDYVLGLEPANSLFYGRPYHEERGDVHMLAPFEKETFRLKFSVLEGKEAIQRVIGRIDEICGMQDGIAGTSAHGNY